MSYLKGKKIFVTGGTGFLGSHLLEALVDEGAVVSALYRSEEKLKSFKEQDKSLKNLNINWVKGDLFSDWSLKDFDFVYHLAGYVGYTKEERRMMEKVNIEGTRAVISKIREAEYKPKMIYSSSVVAVGAGLQKGDILNEDSSFNVSKYNFGYFETKKKAEELVFEEVRKGLRAVAFNPSTIYGPRDMLKGSRKFQLKMAKGELSVCSKGGVSIVHVLDVCDAIIKAAEHGKSGERYILSGDNITIFELLSEIAKQVNVKPPRIVLPTMVLLLLGYLSKGLSFLGIKTGLSLENLQVATMYHWFDSAKAKKELGFAPRSHKEALKDSLSWAKEKGLF
ncbi:MAG: NAD-dependent epimerase/dehydratase family protein [Bdellovibrionales bacterium]